MYLLVKNNNLNGGRFFLDIGNMIDEICDITNTSYSLYQFKNLNDLQYMIKEFDLQIYIINYNEIYNNNYHHYNYSKYNNETDNFYNDIDNIIDDIDNDIIDDIDDDIIDDNKIIKYYNNDIGCVENITLNLKNMDLCEKK